MSEITLVATFPAIAADKVDEFTLLAASSVEIVRGEPGNLQYDWFLSDDRTRCVVVERYVDSDAVLAHLGGVAQVLGQLAVLGGGLEVDVLGELTPQAHAVIEPRVRAIHGRIAGR